MVSLDITVPNMALSALARDLSAVTTGLQRIVDPHALAFTVPLPDLRSPVARRPDLTGPPLFTAGLGFLFCPVRGALEVATRASRQPDADWAAATGAFVGGLDLRLFVPTCVALRRRRTTREEIRRCHSTCLI